MRKKIKVYGFPSKRRILTGDTQTQRICSPDGGRSGYRRRL